MTLADKIQSIGNSLDPKKAYGGKHYWNAKDKVTYLGKEYLSAVHERGMPCLLYSRDGSSISPAGGPFDVIIASHKVCGENYLEVMKGLNFDDEEEFGIMIYTETGEQVFKGSLHNIVGIHDVAGRPYLESTEESQRAYFSRDGKRFDCRWEVELISPLMNVFEKMDLGDKLWETYSTLKNFIRENSEKEKIQIIGALIGSINSAMANYKTKDEAKEELGIMLDQLKQGIMKNPQKFLQDMRMAK